MSYILKSCDLAIILDMSPDDVNALARKGVIKARKIGKQWRYRRQDVSRFLDILQRQTISPMGSIIRGSTGRGKGKA